MQFISPTSTTYYMIRLKGSMIDSPSDFIILILFAVFLKMICTLFDEVFNSEPLKRLTISPWNTRWRDSMRCRIWKGNIPSCVIAMRNQRTTQLWGCFKNGSNISGVLFRFHGCFIQDCYDFHLRMKLPPVPSFGIYQFDPVCTVDFWGCWWFHQIYMYIRSMIYRGRISWTCQRVTNSMLWILVLVEDADSIIKV